MNLSNLEIFIEVYRVGNFSAVARKRKISPSAVSRAISALEAELGALLFYRTTRKIARTESAILLAEQADVHLDALRSLRMTLADSREAAHGVLRVSASHSFGILQLGPLIPEFRSVYPDIKIELVLTDQMVDLVGDRFDVVIRHGELPDSSFIAKTLLQTRYHACGSPAYLSKVPQVTRPEDISALKCLTFPLPGFEHVWRFKNSKSRETEVPIKGDMSVNSGILLRESALKGGGIVMLSDWLIGEDLAAGTLVDLFPAWSATPTNFQTAISAVYPSRKHTPKKVSVFVDFLQQKYSLGKQLI